MKKLLTLFMAFALMLTGCGKKEESEQKPEPLELEVRTTVAKPVIYLYPEEETLVHVEVDFNGTLTTVYPGYEDGWDVIAKPDGTLTDPVSAWRKKDQYYFYRI